MHPIFSQYDCNKQSDAVSKLIAEAQGKALENEETKAKINQLVEEFFQGEEIKKIVHERLTHNYEVKSLIDKMIQDAVKAYLTQHKKSTLTMIHKVAKEVISADKPFFVAIVREYFAGEIRKIAYLAVDKAVKARKTAKK